MKRYLAVTFLAASLFGQTYTVTSLGVLPGYQASLATGINKSGLIVGYSFNSQASETRAFIYNPSTCSLNYLGSLGNGSKALAINDSNKVVGSFQSGPSTTRAFSYLNGVVTDLGGKFNEIALALNNVGDIVGREQVSTLPGTYAASYLGGQAKDYPGYLVHPPFGLGYIKAATGVNDYSEAVGAIASSGSDGLPILGMIYYAAPGEWHQITPLAANPAFPGLELSLQPLAINNLGHVVGTAGAAILHAFFSPFWFSPTVDLGTLNPSDPYALSVATAINNHDAVVGFASDPAPPHNADAFLYNGTTMIDLNTRLTNGEGWHLLSANAINDNGEIVGTGTYNNQQVAFLLTPNDFVRSIRLTCGLKVWAPVELTLQ
jgi:probable HAF family extracellular repeat protein